MRPRMRGPLRASETGEDILRRVTVPRVPEVLRAQATRQSITDRSGAALIVHGTSDINVPFSHAELLAEEISGAVLHAIPNADHMMPFSHDEEAQAVLAEFMNGLDD